ncbi:MAG: NDP-sugar pyrophosphorylase family protein [Alteromonadaceae bacterium]
MTTLVILAAGQGSRFGSPKQFSRFGPLNKTLMEYNICHAISAGFTKIIFITQHIFKDNIENNIIAFLPKSINYIVVIQELDDLPKPCIITPNRRKPLGTAHAIWCVREQITDSFAVINADDYYGESAFVQLINNNQRYQDHHLIVAYLLEKTLSKNGSVNRGFCTLSDDNLLTGVKEYQEIIRTKETITGKENNKDHHVLPADTLVSMNCWLFNPDIFSIIEQLLINTFTDVLPIEEECYLPHAVMQHISQESKKIKVLTSHEDWFGLTYAADSKAVSDSIIKLTHKGLFSSLLVF